MGYVAQLRRMSDSDTTIHKLKQSRREFREERDWLKFHDPQNLAEAICIEASELLELFLWKNSEESKTLLHNDPCFRKSVQDELADIVCFALNFAMSQL